MELVVAIEEIIRDLYTAATGRGEWRLPLSSLATLLDLWAVQVAGIDKRNGTLLFSFEGGPFPPETSLDYLRKYHHINPRVAPLMTLPPNSWFHDHEYFDDEFVAQNPFYQDFLIPYGGRYCSIINVVDNENMVVGFSAMRGIGKQPLNADEIELLGRVKFHMAQAMENYLYLRETCSEISAGKQLLNNIRYPMLLVDDDLSIRFRNDAAEIVLAEGVYVTESGGTLCCRHIVDGDELLDAVRLLNLRHPEAVAGSARDRSIARIRKASDGRPVLVFLIAIRPRDVMSAFGNVPQALLVFHDPDAERIVDPFIVAETFGLTPAESRVAVNLVKGLTVKEMARQMGVSPTTVKSQLQSIYAKTGTKRQAELCVLLTSIYGFSMAGINPLSSYIDGV